MPARSRIPSLRHHKASGQGVVTLGGRDFYCGTWGTQTARDSYDRHIGEWLEAGRRPLADPDDGPTTVQELCAAYNRSDELKRSSHAYAYRIAMRIWLRLYRMTAVDDFGPLALKVVRKEFVAAGLNRKTVNARVDQLRRIIKWGIGHEMVDANVLPPLMAVPGLTKGETTAAESRKVKGVAVEHVEACLPFMGKLLAAMVKLQLHTGMRADELCQLRTGDLDTSGFIWSYTPGKHKTEHHGHARIIEIGEHGRAALEPWLLPDLSAIVFSPVRSEEVRLAELHAGRVTPLHRGNRPGTNRVKSPRRAKGMKYTTASYRRAIERAIDRAFPPPADLARGKGETDSQWRKRLGPDKWKALRKERRQYRWTPHQVRHTFGQMARDRLGIEHAQASLGHKQAKMTEIYAQADKAKAVEVAMLIG